MTNEEYAEEITQKQQQIETLEADILKLDKTLQKQRDINNQLRRVNRNVEREINQIDSLVNTMLEQLPKVTFSTAKTEKSTDKNKLKKRWGVIQLSDIHANTKVLPDEANGNEYNFEVLSKRLKLYINKSIETFKSMKISGVYVILSGDLVSSTRRDDEKLAQITSLVNASYILVDMLKQSVNLLVKNGFNVTITGVVGNESRLNQDNFAASRISSSENFDWVILQMLHAIYSETKNKVQVILPQNPSLAIATIPTEKGFNLLINHGYGLKATEDGAQGVLRSVSNVVDRIDLAIFGHLHHTANYENCCWCGSLIGNNAYSTSKGYSSKASQNLYIIEDDNTFVSMPIQLQNGWENIEGFSYDHNIADEAYLKKEYGYGNKGPIVILR